MGSNTADVLQPTEHCIAGISIAVWGLKAARHASSVVCIFALHGRGSDKDSVRWVAERIASLRKVAGRTVLVVTLDHRNHGQRLVSERANQSWRNTRSGRSDDFVNPSHAPDMVAIQFGTARDVSDLIDFIPAVLFPSAPQPPPISAWVVAGVSLGGHSTWIIGARDPRVEFLVPIIGSPNCERLLRGRAANFQPPISFEPPVMPAALLELLRQKDPCNALADVWRDKAILVLGGAADQLVPHVDGGTEDFVKRLRSDGQVKSVDVFVQDSTGHKCTSEMVNRLCEWLPRALQT